MINKRYMYYYLKNSYRIQIVINIENVYKDLKNMTH